MKRITSLAAAAGELEAQWPSRTTLHRMSLDYMRELMDYLGNPQDSCKAIHVAGTSGKTSTAYYTAALLKNAGKKVGLAVSPHVAVLSERVQIDLQPLADDVFVSELNEFMALIEKGNFEPNYFELLYAFAFWEFARHHVEYAVVEVGVGGLLDNTNVMTRSDKVCIITDIGFDHMSLLGNTLPEITAQKAGIILLHNAVFCWRQADEVMQVVRITARQKQADLHELDAPTLGDDFLFLPLFQRRNFELALNTAQFVLERDGGELKGHGMLLAAHTVIPARMEIHQLQGKTVIIDGSHNPQKIHALAESIREQFPDQPVAALVGFANSRTPENRAEDGTQEFMALADHLILTSFEIDRNPPHRSMDPEKIAASCKAAGYTSFEIIRKPKQALTALLQRPEPILLVAGSFFLLNSVRPLLAKVLE